MLKARRSGRNCRRPWGTCLTGLPARYPFAPAPGAGSVPFFACSAVVAFLIILSILFVLKYVLLRVPFVPGPENGQQDREERGG